MNWDAIGVLAEIISAVAVVVTLAYLIVEVRQNRKVAETASVDLLSAGWNSINNQIIAVPEFAHVMMKGFSDPDTLNQAEWDRFFILVQSYVNHFMTVKKHYEAGHLPEEEWEFHSIGISHLMNSPGGKRACNMAAITPSVRAIFEKNDRVEFSEEYFSVLRDRVHFGSG